MNQMNGPPASQSSIVTNGYNLTEHSVNIRVKYNNRPPEQNSDEPSSSSPNNGSAQYVPVNKYKPVSTNK
jgi:hypothetical protein